MLFQDLMLSVPILSLLFQGTSNFILSPLHSSSITFYTKGKGYALSRDEEPNGQCTLL